MRLSVFGATGKTGALIVKAALAADHEVNAFVRDPAKMTGTHERLHVVQGDAADADSVVRAIEGCDAVISALGSGHNTLTMFGEVAVPAMQRLSVKRIVSLVGAGVSEPGDPASIGRTIMLTLMGLIAKGVLEDASRHADQLRQSELDWTLVRPPRLADGEATGNIEHAPTLKLGPSRSITRADLAQFMLTVVTSDQYIRQSPMVANTA